MFGLFESLAELAVDTAKLVTKPIEMAADLTDAAMKPFVDAAFEMAQDIKSLKD